MIQPQHIHISDIRTFRSCRRKWSWASPLQQNLEPSTPYAPFFVGRAVHHCLENHYRHQISVWDSLDKFLENEKQIAGALWRGEEEKWQDSVDLITEMLDHYMLWIQVDTSDFRDENLEFLRLEVPFEVKMYVPGTNQVDPRIKLEGRFDGMVRHKPTDTYWIWETKTARSIKELTLSLENDEQAGAYIYAAQQLNDIKFTGILYNILRKKAPTHPQPLQNNFLAQRTNADLTVFSFVTDVKRHHGDDVTWEFIEQFYGKMLSSYSIGDNGFFARIPVRRSQTEITQLTNNLYWTAMEMIDPNTHLYPSPTFIQCNFCPFRAPCLAMNRGGDYNALLEAEYQTRTKAESFREVEV